VRGSGGNLGVVTSLLYRLHEVGPVIGGGVFFPIAQARDVLRFLRDFTANLPDELTVMALALTHPEAGPVFGVGVCYSGSHTEGEKVLKPLRTFGKPVADVVMPMPLVAVQSMFDPFFPPGRQVFEHWHGATTRIGPTDTAFPHRTHPFNFFAWSTWVDPAETDLHMRWTRQFWDDMKPHLASGSYVNYISDDEDGTARAAFGPNYERLATLKNRYDPTNLFRMNHNVRPAP
jgi:FAD/FMN-containing dehydrogenase